MHHLQVRLYCFKFISTANSLCWNNRKKGLPRRLSFFTGGVSMLRNHIARYMNFQFHLILLISFYWGMMTTFNHIRSAAVSLEYPWMSARSPKLVRFLGGACIWLVIHWPCLMTTQSDSNNSWWCHFYSTACPTVHHSWSPWPCCWAGRLWRWSERFFSIKTMSTENSW